MSAYVVDREHIQFMVDAAMRGPLGVGRRGGLAWVFDVNRATGNYKRHELPVGDYKRAAEVGQMLWDENVASVSRRYPDCNGKDLPGPIGETYKYGKHVARPRPLVDPVAVIKACHGYEYQACEHDGWEDSEAHAFIDALVKRACTSLKGYDDAAWAF